MSEWEPLIKISPKIIEFPSEREWKKLTEENQQSITNYIPEYKTYKKEWRKIYKISRVDLLELRLSLWTEKL